MTWRLFALLDTFNWLLSIVLQLPSLKKRWNYIYQNENDTHSLFKKKKKVYHKINFWVQFRKLDFWNVVLSSLLPLQKNHEKSLHGAIWATGQPPSSVGQPDCDWAGPLWWACLLKPKHTCLDGCPFARKLSLFLVCYRKGTITFKV